jgi:hypothetical protein
MTRACGHYPSVEPAPCVAEGLGNDEIAVRLNWRWLSADTIRPLAAPVLDLPTSPGLRQGRDRPRPRMSGSADEQATRTSGSGEVEPIEVHDLVPRGHEVTHELLLRVVARVDL